MEYFAIEALRTDQPAWFMNLHAHPLHGGGSSARVDAMRSVAISIATY